MGDLLVWIVAKENASIVWAVLVLVVAEFALDVVHDLVMDFIRRKRNEGK